MGAGPLPLRIWHSSLLWSVKCVWHVDVIGLHLQRVNGCPLYLTAAQLHFRTLGPHCVKVLPGWYLRRCEVRKVSDEGLYINCFIFIHAGSLESQCSSTFQVVFGRILYLCTSDFCTELPVLYSFEDPIMQYVIQQHPSAQPATTKCALPLYSGNLVGLEGIFKIWLTKTRNKNAICWGLQSLDMVAALVSPTPPPPPQS